MTNSDRGKVITSFSPSRSNAGHFFLVGVIFLTTFVTSCAVIRHYLPFPEIPLMRDKIEYLARHGDEFDVLFLGSSRVHCQIMPEVFDRVAGENGVPVKSFNAGLYGMRSPEDDYVLEQILLRPHRRLRWIFVEISRLGTGVAREDTARFTYWHDTPHLLLVVRRLCEQARESEARLPREVAATFSARYAIWSETAGLLGGHAQHWLTRAINLGSGSEVLARWLRAPHEKYRPAKSLGETHDGWLTMARKREEMSGPILEKFQRDCAERLAQPAGKQRGDPVSQSALERTLATITHAGIAPLLLVPPTPSGENFFPTAAREQELQILDYSDLRKYPELFTPEHRIDGDHLNNEGAEVFSILLARKFVDLAKPTSRMP